MLRKSGKVPAVFLTNKGVTVIEGINESGKIGIDWSSVIDKASLLFAVPVRKENSGTLEVSQACEPLLMFIAT